MTNIYEQKISAFAPGNFAFDPGDPKSTNDLRRANDAFNSDGNDYNEVDNWSLFKIYVKDFAGTGGRALLYSEPDSSNFNDIGGGNSTSHQPVFSFTYFCSVPGNKISTTRPGGDPQVVYEIKYGIILQNNSREAAKFMDQDTFSGSAGILQVKRTDTNPGSTETRNVFGPDDPKNIANPKILNSNSTGNFGIDDPGCQPPNALVGNFSGSSGMSNYNKLSADQKKDFAPAVKAAAAADSASNDTDPCLQNGGKLGWLFCSLINLGSETTDYVFNGLVKPLLEDIPVSTNSSDGTYIAWKSFRIIGNIVLVGTMLAVVYAQIRGDR